MTLHIQFAPALGTSEVTDAALNRIVRTILTAVIAEGAGDPTFSNLTARSMQRLEGANQANIDAREDSDRALAFRTARVDAKALRGSSIRSYAGHWRAVLNYLQVTIQTHPDARRVAEARRLRDAVFVARGGLAFLSVKASKETWQRGDERLALLCREGEAFFSEGEAQHALTALDLEHVAFGVSQGVTMAKEAPAPPPDRKATRAALDAALVDLAGKVCATVDVDDAETLLRAERVLAAINAPLPAKKPRSKRAAATDPATEAKSTTTIAVAELAQRLSMHPAQNDPDAPAQTGT